MNLHIMPSRTISLVIVLIKFAYYRLVYADFFERNVHLDDRSVTNVSSGVETSVSLDQCALNCHDSSECLSFAYSLKDGRCEMLSRMYLQPEETYFNPGNKVFWKIQHGTCKLPTAINKGRLLFIDGQMEGSKAQFVCDDFYIPTIEHIVCDSSGRWMGLHKPCERPVSTYRVPAVGRIYPGVCVEIIATPTNETKFWLSFKNSMDNICHIEALFEDYDNNQILLRNSAKNDTWGTPEKEIPYWPFVVYHEFTLIVCAGKTMYTGFVDGEEMLTFQYRLPISDITKVVLGGAVTLRKIRFRG